VQTEFYELYADNSTVLMLADSTDYQVNILKLTEQLMVGVIAVYEEMLIKHP